MNIPASSIRSRLRRPALALALFILSMASAAFCVAQFGARVYRWQAFDIELRLQPSAHGQTRLLLPPLGEVRAATHQAPVALAVSLQALSLPRLSALAAKPPRPKDLERDLTREARRDLIDFALRQIGWGALGGLLVPLILRVRRSWAWPLCPLAGAASVALLLWSAVRSYDPHAFENLTYVGPLKQAGPILALTRTAFTRADQLSSRLRGVAGDLDTLYGRIQTLPALAPGQPTVRLLHISDIHNNAAALDFVQEIAARFPVDAVVDTGDLTDFGTPVEARLTQGLAKMRIPHVFVAGNHDSQATLKALRAAPNTIILNDQPVSVAGLWLLGNPDPSSARASVGSVDTSDAAIRDAAARLAQDVRLAPDRPDVVCVHNPRQAQDVVGHVPVVLCGHLHQLSLNEQDGTVIANAGTTGGAGLRYFDKAEGVPLSAEILTFSQAPHPHLLFIDQVVVSGSLGEYSLTRRSFSSGPAHP